MCHIAYAGRHVHRRAGHSIKCCVAEYVDAGTWRPIPYYGFDSRTVLVRIAAGLVVKRDHAW